MTPPLTAVDTDFLKADLAGAVQLFPTAAIFGGNNITVSADDLTREMEFGDSGIQRRDTQEVYVALSEFGEGAVPKSEDLITVGGRKMIVDSVGKTQDGIALIMQLRADLSGVGT